jgi:hypothetical protein
MSRIEEAVQKYKNKSLFDLYVLKEHLPGFLHVRCAPFIVTFRFALPALKLK